MFSLCLIPTSACAELPVDARRLVDARARELERIDKKFITELESLKVAHMKRGDLNAANEVANLIWSVQSKHVRQLSGKWKRDRDGCILEFDGKGHGLFNGSDKFTVQFDSEKQRFEIRKQGWEVNYLTLTDNPDVILASIPGIYDYKLTKEK